MNNTEKITHIVMNCQVLQDRLHDQAANRNFRQSLKNKANSFLKELWRVESQYFDKFYDKSELSTKYVYDVYDTFISEISKVPIYDMPNIIMIIKAYNKDSKSIEGICKKILK